MSRTRLPPDDPPPHPADDSLQRFRLLAEAAFEGIVFTENGVVLDCNDQMTELTGRPRADLVGLPVSEFVAPEHRDRVAEARRANRQEPYEHLMLHPTRGTFPVEVRSRMARVGGREVRVTAVRDVADRAAAEEALRAGRDKLDSIFRAAPVGIGVVLDRVFVEVNERICEMLGYTRAELIGHNARLVYPDDEEYDRVGRDKYGQIRDSGTGTVETRWRRRDGSIIDVLISSSPIDLRDWSAGVTFTVLDITERKRADAEQDRLRAQLAQAQKMESIGRLAGGVAHDFNNMLQAILGNVALALDDGSGSALLREYLGEIERAATRSGDLTRQLLAFARKQTVHPRILDLNDTVAGMLKMLHRLIGEDIQLVWQPGRDLWTVNVDPGQIDQALANLTVNARDAIAGVGRITIETANVSEARDFALASPVAGEFVRLAVHDTGIGMNAEIQGQIFEPFFTTKEVGKGTGLGLATVYGIVKQNGGYIDVVSAAGAGTTLALYLPRAAPAEVHAEAGIERPMARGSETVLVVEDEEQVLVLVRTVLERHGYAVLSARHPEDGLAQAAAHPGPIHLLLADVVMPGMNGRDLCTRISALKAGVRCLFVSGYTADVIAHQGVLDEGVQFLQKPFSIPALTAAVRAVLDGDDV